MNGLKQQSKLQNIGLQTFTYSGSENFYHKKAKIYKSREQTKLKHNLLDKKLPL